LSPTRVEGRGHNSERRAFAISVEGTDAAGRFRRVPSGLTAMGQGVIFASDGKEGCARPYQELIWGIPVYTIVIAFVVSRSYGMAWR